MRTSVRPVPVEQCNPACCTYLVTAASPSWTRFTLLLLLPACCWEQAAEGSGVRERERERALDPRGRAGDERHAHGTTTFAVNDFVCRLASFFGNWAQVERKLSWEIIYVQHAASQPMERRQRCTATVREAGDKCQEALTLWIG
ncbi:putative retrotransposon hot spot protein 4 (RHS4) [Trypanosoma vivax]|nr:putative retrotransposon hot spot protein 4 (RHS4) [Trypanosoma vivax]